MSNIYSPGSIVYFICVISDDAESTSSLMAAVSSMEVNTDRLSLCLINDCADMDIPLFELHLNGKLSLQYRAFLFILIEFVLVVVVHHRHLIVVRSIHSVFVMQYIIDVEFKFSLLCFALLFCWSVYF